MVFVGHFTSQTPHPMHLSVMKWGMFGPSVYLNNYRARVDVERFDAACTADHLELRRGALANPEEHAARERASRLRHGPPARMLGLRGRKCARRPLDDGLEI